jgi:hypothetical protein
MEEAADLQPQADAEEAAAQAVAAEHQKSNASSRRSGGGMCDTVPVLTRSGTFVAPEAARAEAC